MIDKGNSTYVDAIQGFFTEKTADAINCFGDEGSCKEILKVFNDFAKNVGFELRTYISSATTDTATTDTATTDTVVGYISGAIVILAGAFISYKASQAAYNIIFPKKKNPYPTQGKNGVPTY